MGAAQMHEQEGGQESDRDQRTARHRHGQQQLQQQRAPCGRAVEAGMPGEPADGSGRSTIPQMNSMVERMVSASR